MSHLPDAQQFEKHCRLQVNFGTAAYEIPNCAKLWCRTVWNIINTGNFTVLVYRASLVDGGCSVLCCVWWVVWHSDWQKRCRVVFSLNQMRINGLWQPHPTLPFRLIVVHHCFHMLYYVLFTSYIVDLFVKIANIDKIVKCTHFLKIVT